MLGTLGRSGVASSIILLFLLSAIPAGAFAAPAPTLPPTASVAAHPAPAHSKIAPVVSSPVGRPFHAPHHSKLSHKLTVDPGSFYFSEPAPMGIADFGVDQNLNGYTYNTTQFYGDVRIASLKSFNAGVSPTTSMGYQLNVVLWFDAGGTSYYYWIQDVVFIDTATYTVNYINNIWNFSASGASVSGTDLGGNGSDGGGFYYTYASSLLPGNYVTLSPPFDIGLKVISLVKNGHPLVKFEYQDGGGWVTYDDVLFSASPVKQHDFIVDGTQYNPATLFNDAELIMGGPGGGSNVQINSSAARMTLSFWNGHNFQPVTNAYNHGSDTAEGVTNSTIAGRSFLANGTLYANSTSGNGNLGVLYDRSSAGIVSITTPYRFGTIKVNATSAGNFTGGAMNLTLAPGKYQLSLYENASRQGSQNVTLSPGGNLAIYFGAGPRYNVTFSETGLPLGTNWSVTVAGFSRWSYTSTILMPVWNGTWTYKLGFVSGWSAASGSGRLSVSGGPTTVSTTWSQVVYSTVFTQTGLPANTNWSVTVGNTTLAGVNPSLTFFEPNGTSNYQIRALPGFVPTPGTGSVFVAGFTVRVPVSWSVFSYNITFTSTGLPVGTQWNVTSGTVTAGTTGSFLVLHLPNGSQPWATSVVPGFRPTQGAKGQVAVGGGPASVQLTWSRVLYTVTVQESGLSPGTSWQVSVGNLSASGSTSTLVVDRANGTYVIGLGKSAGYVAIYYPVSVSLHGKSVNIAVTFAPSTTVISFQLSGLAAGSIWSVSAVSGGSWQNVTGVATTLNLSLSNGSWAYTVTVPVGWSASPSSGLLSVTGSPALVSIEGLKATGYLHGSGVPSGASVYVDGRAVSSPGGVFNVTLPIGTHSVEVTAPGFDALFENVTITQGKTVVVPLDLTRSPPASTSGGFGGIPLLYLAVIGVVVLAAVGVVAYYRARRPPTEEIDPTAAPELFPEEAEPAEMPAVDPEDVDPAFR